MQLSLEKLAGYNEKPQNYNTCYFVQEFMTLNS